MVSYEPLLIDLSNAKSVDIGIQDICLLDLKSLHTAVTGSISGRVRIFSSSQGLELGRINGAGPPSQVFVPKYRYMFLIDANNLPHSIVTLQCSSFCIIFVRIIQGIKFFVFSVFVFPVHLILFVFTVVFLYLSLSLSFLGFLLSYFS